MKISEPEQSSTPIALIRRRKVSELEELRETSRNLIINTCNIIGCKDCAYKWEGGCSSTEIEARIMEIELTPPTKRKGKEGE